MSYRRWFEAHGTKHAAVMRKLTHLSDAEVIAYFRYENMVKHEPDFCPLYKEGKKCHDIHTLNCYLCACPNFRFDDNGFETVEGKRRKSYCAVNSPNGDIYESAAEIHQNCAGCSVPHDEGYIARHFQRDWFAIMRDVAPSNGD